MKYIIFNDCFPVVFFEGIPHTEQAKGTIFKPTSAGFYDKKRGCYGYSNSLNLKSRPEDTEIIRKFIEG